MFCIKKSFYLFLLLNIVNALLQYYLFIILTLPTPSPGKYYGDPLHSPPPPVPRKKSGFNLLLDLNDKNNDLSFAPNLVIFPNPKILVLQNDFSFHFCQVYWENLIKKKNKTCLHVLIYIYIYIMIFLLYSFVSWAD